MDFNLYDEQGNQIKPPMCKCGKVCDTCLMGVRYHTWTCHECIVKEAKSQTYGLVYRQPVLQEEYGSSQPIDFLMSKEEMAACKEAQLKHLEEIGVCSHCARPDAIISEETCCKGCARLADAPTIITQKDFS